MDTSLFGKYKKEIEKQKNKKQTIIEIIKQSTGVVLQEHEIETKKNQITFHIPSTKKSTLYKKQINTILIEKGFTIK